MSTSGGIQAVDTGAEPGRTPLSATSGSVANAQAVATLPNAAGKTTWITGFDVTASGSTAALVVDVQVAGPATVLHYAFTFPAGAAVAAAPLVVRFPVDIPAFAPNSVITVTVPAGGAGNTNCAVNAYGYQA